MTRMKCFLSGPVCLSVTFNPAVLDLRHTMGTAFNSYNKPLSQAQPLCFMPVKPVWIVLPSDARAHTKPIEQGVGWGGEGGVITGALL